MSYLSTMRGTCSKEVYDYHSRKWTGLAHFWMTAGHFFFTLTFRRTWRTMCDLLDRRAHETRSASNTSRNREKENKKPNRSGRKPSRVTRFPINLVLERYSLLYLSISSLERIVPFPRPGKA